MISLLLPTMYQRMSQAGSLDLNVRREVEGKGGQVDITPDQRFSLGVKSSDHPPQGVYSLPVV